VRVPHLVGRVATQDELSRIDCHHAFVKRQSLVSAGSLKKVTVAAQLDPHFSLDAVN